MSDGESTYIKQEPVEYDESSESNGGSDWGSEYFANLSVAVKIDTEADEKTEDYADTNCKRKWSRRNKSPIQSRKNPSRSTKNRRSYAEDIKKEQSDDSYDEMRKPYKPSRSRRGRYKRTPEDGEPKRQRRKSSPLPPGQLTESQLIKKKRDGTITEEELGQLREMWRKAWVHKKRNTKRKIKKDPEDKPRKAKSTKEPTVQVFVNGVGITERELRLRKKEGTLTPDEDAALKAHYREQAQKRRAKLRENETEEEREVRLAKERYAKRFSRSEGSTTSQIIINGVAVAEGQLRRKKKTGTLTAEEDAALKKHYREQAQQRRAKLRQMETDEERELRLARERESKRKRRSENPDYKEMERERYKLLKASKTEEQIREKRQREQLKRLMMTDEEKQIEKFRNLVNRTERMKRMTDEEKEAMKERMKQRRLERMGFGKGELSEQAKAKQRQNLRNYYQRMTEEKRDGMRRQMRRKYHERLGALQNNPRKWEEAEARYEESERLRKERGIPKAVSLRFLNIPAEEKQARSRERKDFMKSMRKAYETVRGHKFYPIKVSPEMQQLIENGMTINQARSVLETPEEREKRLRNQRFTSAKQRLKRKLAKVGASPEEVKRQLEQLSRTYDGGTWLQRPYKPHPSHRNPAKSPNVEKRKYTRRNVDEDQKPPTYSPQPTPTPSPPPPQFQGGFGLSWPQQQQYRFPPQPTISSLFPPPPSAQSHPAASTSHDVKFYEYPSPEPQVYTPPPYPPQVTYAPASDVSSDYADQMSGGGGDDGGGFDAESSDESEPETAPTNLPRPIAPPIPPPAQMVPPSLPKSEPPELEPYRRPGRDLHGLKLFSSANLMPPPPNPRPPGKRGPKRKERDWSLVNGKPRRGPIPHNAGKTVERDTVCDLCGRLCISTSIHLHKRYNHNPHWIDKKCALCNIPFKTVCQFDKHYTAIHGELFIKPGPYKRSRKKGTGTRVDKSMFHDGVCDLCGKTMFRCLLKRHKFMQHGDGAKPEMAVRCKYPACPTRFRDPASLKRHYIRTHGEQDIAESHVCSRCFDAKFESMELLGKHVQAAHPDQFFTCTYCTLWRYTLESLKFHVMRCNHGPKNPTAIIDERLMNVTPSDGLITKCELCSAPICVRALAKHFLTMHNIREEKVPCGYCEKSFQCRKAHIEHLDIKHGLSQEQLLEIMSKLRVNNREGKTVEELMLLGGPEPPKAAYTRVGMTYRKRTAEELAAAREHRRKYGQKPEKKVKRSRRNFPKGEGTGRKSRKGMKYKKKPKETTRGRKRVKKEVSSEEEWNSSEEETLPSKKRGGALEQDDKDKHNVEETKRLVIIVKKLDQSQFINS